VGEPGLVRADARRRPLWISKPGARHSLNIAQRPQVGIVIFDSTQPPGTGSGVYAEATVEEVPEQEI
jgi:hypothetical protein